MVTQGNEMTVAEIESRVGARPAPETIPFPGTDGAESLNRTFKSRPTAEKVHIELGVGIIPILHLVREELSTVINQAKAALLKPDRMGIGQPGFDPVSVTGMARIVDGAIALCEVLVFQPDLDIRDRMTAMALGDYMDKFQYNLFGLETDSLGRSDMCSLLPALQEFKQVCMELELKLVLGESAAEKPSAA